jgi:hypothetical protein
VSPSAALILEITDFWNAVSSGRGGAPMRWRIDVEAASRRAARWTSPSMTATPAWALIASATPTGRRRR